MTSHMRFFNERNMLLFSSVMDKEATETKVHLENQQLPDEIISHKINYANLS